jgi:hypothetical protein
MTPTRTSNPGYTAALVATVQDVLATGPAATAAAVAEDRWEAAVGTAERIRTAAAHLHATVVRDALAAGLDWWRIAGLLGVHPQAAYAEHGHTLDGLLPPAAQRPDLAVIYTAGLAALHDLDPRFGIELDDFGPDHPLTGDPTVTRLRAAAGLLGEDIWIAVTLPDDAGEDEPDTTEAITQWTSVAIQPQDLQWLREAIALNTAESQEGPQDDEDDPGLEFS